MKELILIIHVLTIITIIGLVLIQQGKGSETSAALGSGASNTMFGSAGNVSFLAKLTAVLGLIFFMTSLFLGVYSGHKELVSQNASLDRSFSK